MASTDYQAEYRKTIGRFATGVTVILPHGGNLFQEKVPAAVHVGNAFGKLMGPRWAWMARRIAGRFGPRGARFTSSDFRRAPIWRNDAECG